MRFKTACALAEARGKVMTKASLASDKAATNGGLPKDAFKELVR